MENRRKAIITVSVIGILIGIFCIIVSGIVFSENGGTHTKRLTYGGDAYTGIQNAAANTSNNVALLHNLVALVSGYAFLIVGLIMIWKSICKLVEPNAYFDKKTSNTSNHECNKESSPETQPKNKNSEPTTYTYKKSEAQPKRSFIKKSYTDDELRALPITSLTQLYASDKITKETYDRIRNENKKRNC